MRTGLRRDGGGGMNENHGKDAIKKRRMPKRIPNRRAPALVSSVRRMIALHGMIKAGEKVLVACSGGADSTALLHVLHELREEGSFRLAVAHYDHGLRRASGRDARFVHDLAADLGLTFYMEKADVRAIARKRGLNLEEAGRRLRYEFLRRTASEIGATKIATGHTLDDQAETVLIRLLRGSGSRGLGGIAPVSENRIIRPLLGARRRDIEDYLKDRGLSHREDETNRDLRFLRNRIRRRLIPYLEKNFEPEVVGKLGRTADVLAAEDRSLDEATGPKTAELVEGNGRRARLNAAGLAALSTGLARRCVRLFIGIHKGDLLRVSFDDVEKIRNLRDRKTAVLPGELRFIREGDRIMRGPARSRRNRPRRGFEYRWDGTAALSVVETGVVFKAFKLHAAPSSTFRYDNAVRAYLRADRLAFPLVVRSLREGDVYRPLGAPGRKKLTEVLRAKGVPVAERGRRAVFVSGDEIVWMEGLPVAENYKIGPSIRRVFLIEKADSEDMVG